MPAEVEPAIDIVEQNEAGHIERLTVSNPYVGHTTYYYVRVHGEAQRSFSTEKQARKYLYERTHNLRERNQATYTA